MGKLYYGEKCFCISKRILRIIAGVNITHTCRNLFHELNILTLTGLYIFAVCNYAFVNKNKFQRNNEVHQYHTRNGDDFRAPSVNLDISRTSLHWMGPKLLNRLPSNITQSTQMGEFKRN